MISQARHARDIFNMASEKKTMDAKKILNLKLLKYHTKVPTLARCRSQVWQHFGFKVTYNDNGLRFKSSTEVICQASFHRKQES